MPDDARPVIEFYSTAGEYGAFWHAPSEGVRGRPLVQDFQGIPGATFRGRPP